MNALIEDPVDLFIGGVSLPASDGSRLENLDPATGKSLVEVADAQRDDVQRAIDAARAAAPAWARRVPRERGAILIELARLMRRDHRALAELESLDTGKPMAQALTDVEVAAQYFEFYGGFADKLYGDTIPLGGDSFAATFPEPHGVTGHIVPWNYPLQIGSRTVAPSLMAGNACVLKPAEEAPITAVSVAHLAMEAGLPPGVLNVVPGRGEVAGAYLSESDDVDHISFTGGLDTGRLVMAAAARNVKPITLELGGKSPSIVLDDADLDRAVPALTRALIQNAGQTCSAGTRVVVHRSIHDELVDRLTRRLAEVTVGAGIEDPEMGPLISDRQRTRVLGYLDIARQEGAVATVGGEAREVPGWPGGFFVAPTLLAGVTPEMRVAREEIFGPVLAVLVADDEQEAVSIANSTSFGLLASVWTRNTDRAFRVARNIRAGQVYINSYGAGGGVGLPFGGSKHSGFGREKGVEAVLEYTQTKAIVVDVAGDVSP